MFWDSCLLLWRCIHCYCISLSLYHCWCNRFCDLLFLSFLSLSVSISSFGTWLSEQVLYICFIAICHIQHRQVLFLYLVFTRNVVINTTLFCLWHLEKQSLELDQLKGQIYHLKCCIFFYLSNLQLFIWEKKAQCFKYCRFSDLAFVDRSSRPWW